MSYIIVNINLLFFRVISGVIFGQFVSWGRSICFFDSFNWIIKNQLSRRNLTGQQATYLRGKRYLAEKGINGDSQYMKSGSDASSDPPKGETAEHVGKKYGKFSINSEKSKTHCLFTF